MQIKESELILNPNGSVYHLNLKPENIAENVIFVGDQDRVEKITKHFDTGIGPDNIDIVLNELDALVNIDLKTRQPKVKLTSLNIIRIGTSGSLQHDIPVDSIVISTHGLDLNAMLHAYQINPVTNPDIEQAFIAHTNWNSDKGRPLIINNDSSLEKRFESPQVFKGITATAGGFYGPQGRVLRLPLQDPDLNHKIDSFNFNGLRITNLEMETSVIYGLSKLLGHKALSLNTIIANRANGTFSKNPGLAVENVIKYALERI